MNKTEITGQPDRKQLEVLREFNGPPDMVWKAWTESDLLDQWWAPEPWKVETKHMEFREGGYWLYSMNGPDGDKQYCRADFENIVPQEWFTFQNAFATEAGHVDTNYPLMQWKVHFSESATGTKVEVQIKFDSVEDMEKIVEMGFREGFTAAHKNLDRYLETQFKLRRENKTSNAARVSTYLNFPGKTEEAFHFYKKVFKGEFTGVGLRRFDDTELPDEHPPMSAEDQKLIIHAELTIMAGHVLMATDSPESMGFKLEEGNNMHINIEPDSKKEAKRLFDALSEDGKVTMPLQDKFWGAYSGTCTDKYGINWMINHQASQ